VCVCISNGLFNDAASSLGYVASNVMEINELQLRLIGNDRGLILVTILRLSRGIKEIPGRLHSG
jgi:hypothetical protein